MRNSADHGIEPRGAAEIEQVRVRDDPHHVARGSHVLIRISDDGRGLARDKIGGKAVKQSFITESELASMSDREECRR